MVIILMYPFVINPLFKAGFFSLYHYGKYKANSSVSVNERIQWRTRTVPSIEILCIYKLLIKK